MSQAKEIRTQIVSIKSTQKITRAMELVAASKMRKAQDRMLLSKPYSRKIRQVISHVAASHSEYLHPFLLPRQSIQRVGWIVVTSDRGLCGGLNINLLRKVMTEIKPMTQKNIGIDYCLVGRKAQAFFNRHGGHILASASHLGDNPTLKDLIGIVKVMLDHYECQKLDAVFIASNEFINTMNQKPYIRKLLPLEPDPSTKKGHWDYIYEPDCARDLLNMLLRRYIESQVYQAVVENMACFQAAQMVAMKNATDNACELISDLQLTYNKARQASITAEISEIVAGAAAIES